MPNNNNNNDNNDKDNTKNSTNYKNNEITNAKNNQSPTIPLKNTNSSNSKKATHSDVSTLPFFDEVLNSIVKGEIVDNATLTTTVFHLFLLVGITIHIFFGNMTSTNGNYGSATSLIWGYSIIIFSLLSILFFDKFSNEKKILGSDIKSIPIDILLLMFLMLWTILINVKYKKKINSRRVPARFYTFSYFSTILITLQLFTYIGINFLKSKAGQVSGLIKERISSFQILSYITLGLIFIITLIQQLILDNFSVDVL